VKHGVSGQTGQILIFEDDTAGTGAHGTGDDIEDSGFTGTVGADQAGNAAGFEFETAVVDRYQTAETFFQMLD
jgi:hypothetical protein